MMETVGMAEIGDDSAPSYGEIDDDEKLAK